ncbi:hypothetical protein RCL1_002731 [Eukaryota sp. TZLM3-RCL]
MTLPTCCHPHCNTSFNDFIFDARFSNKDAETLGSGYIVRDNQGIRYNVIPVFKRDKVAVERFDEMVSSFNNGPVNHIFEDTFLLYLIHQRQGEQVIATTSDPISICSKCNNEVPPRTTTPVLPYEKATGLPPNESPVAAAMKCVVALLKKLSHSKEEVFSEIVSLCAKEHDLTRNFSESDFNSFRLEFIELLHNRILQQTSGKRLPLYTQLVAKLKASGGDQNTNVFMFYRDLIHCVQSHFLKLFLNTNANTHSVDRNVVLTNIKFIGHLVSASVLPYGIAIDVFKMLKHNRYKLFAVEGFIALWQTLIDLNRSALRDPTIQKALLPAITAAEEFSYDLQLDEATRLICQQFVSDYCNFNSKTVIS